MENQPTQVEYQHAQAPVVPIKEWILTILVASIPIVNLIMLFVWGFGSGNNVNKANWAKAMLIWMAIFLILYFILFAIVGVSLFSSGNF